MNIKPGNSEMFLDLVQGLTGKALTGEAWIETLSETVDDLVAAEKADYEKAVTECQKATGGTEDDISLNMRVIIKDGDECIADSQVAGSFLATCKVFEEYVKARFKTGSNTNGAASDEAKE